MEDPNLDLSIDPKQRRQQLPVDPNNSITSSSAISSPSSFIREVQVALKRHKPLGTMQSKALRPRRVLLPQRPQSKASGDNSAGVENLRGGLPVSGCLGGQSGVGLVEKGEEISLTAPSISGTTTRGPTDAGSGVNETNGQLMTNIGAKNVPSDMSFVSIDRGSGARTSKDPVSQQIEMSDINSRISSCSVVDRFEQEFDLERAVPMIQCATTKSSCLTTMSVNSGPISQTTNPASALQVAVPTSTSASGSGYLNGIQNHVCVVDQDGVHKETDRFHGNAKGSQFDGRATSEVVGKVAGISQPVISSSKNLSSNLESSKASVTEKAPPKKKYNPDMFFKVNGKLYQKLGKIGSGGSSEVYKVISSDCTIYALKKINLKGRDFATAYGFCQEIEYLNKLKGRNNIIQLVDYEVTDKALLEQVVNKCAIANEECVNVDGYLYMVLEYGEIDLAHMLSQQFIDGRNLSWNKKENWLRFYWQQMLEAVNTIHEERIVHSDLKPANFLLVKGSLKLIDFGIAKAILSDTTNIQRDSQVGTLNYMSPEAFMLNEEDEDGSTIKCGRPSDIWSLGCILYQMVYGKTPFAEYKTFWAKLKVIANRNYEIVYEPIPNPWLIDLMKKCLAWDRNERWRIPQLLEHPFLNPRMPFRE